MKTQKTIIAIGAHPDDIEIGCGGALAHHVKNGDHVRMIVMTGGERGGASKEVRLAELKESARVLGIEDVVVLGYEDGHVPFNAESVMAIEAAMQGVEVARAYLPYPHEIHQDHHHTAGAALAACRNVPQILQYEGPSTHPDFQARFYVCIENVIEQKLEALKRYQSQGDKEFLKQESLKGLNRFRGYQARATYAEGFFAYRFIDCP